MEALVLPLLAFTLLAVAIYGLASNRPAVEEDEVKAVRPLLRLLHRQEGGLSEDSPRLRTFTRELEHALAKGYVRRANNGVLTLSDVGDRLRRTGKLAAVVASPDLRT
ncbi:MAG: hypothetical protein KKE02_17355 [Alphaproteobacteria bacterium]|nr:hypothetical protein [Alphaproteobacteria bacterium]MBU1512940.1 hypothetical protein [Alphaproteobacteria bacterium]MBU2094886.1 hypothetical protein [Alphaproteobacteria bacterium]MBU2152792.1 hypothetical protein [Alphaproteobacteria bacterium]MBU2306299.1 hypothetical protein [Alphaproteobacteria bacterium]